MQVYTGSDTVYRISENDIDGNVIYRRKDILVASKDEPSVSLAISEDRRLLIWGHIYAVRCDDGSLIKIGRAHV